MGFCSLRLTPKYALVRVPRLRGASFPALSSQQPGILRAAPLPQTCS